MKILALDQASSKTGFSIYNENKKLLKYGVFDIHDIDEKHNGSLFYQEKIENVKMFLDRIICEYTIDLVVIEDIQSQSNINTYKKLAWLQGVLIQYLYSNKIQFKILSPSEWRKILKIKGKSRKRVDIKLATQEYVKTIFEIEASEDECDAICIGKAYTQLTTKENK